MKVYTIKRSFQIRVVIYFFLFFLFEIFPETHLGWRRITQNTVWCYGLCIPPR
ncbi:Pimeloyl-ACP methyl ester carboxylesterase [Pseudomonas syringae pv. actinidiae]|uniref:Pimeloyl-ACP methyl ester carboxylesterase n=1 Tax=Pseudomonas syringae pv. actinidiae TaxID=103796 RepID=A0AAN4Q639_PSESF|nr:Pimeloyl-ACP methyl ester carboxylesterase [Pseudomonas syringae pv. actinidiae]